MLQPGAQFSCYTQVYEVLLMLSKKKQLCMMKLSDPTNEKKQTKVWRSSNTLEMKTGEC